MAAVLRRALPQDADFIAWTILAAQCGHRPHGWFDIALDRPEPECVAFLRRLAVTPTRSWWHATQFWIADVDGMPAAALCVMPAGDIRDTARVAIEEAVTSAGLSATEQDTIWRRGAYARSCWIQGDDSGWLVEHVATRPSHRGRGLVQVLLDHAFTAGKARVSRAHRSHSTSAMRRPNDATLGPDQLRRGKTRCGLRGAHRRSGLSPLRARDQTSRKFN